MVIELPNRQEDELADKDTSWPANLRGDLGSLVDYGPSPHPAREEAQEGAGGLSGRIYGYDTRHGTIHLGSHATKVLFVVGEIAVPALLSAKKSTVYTSSGTRR